MSAANLVLNQALEAIADRGADYGDANEHFAQVAKLWAAYKGVEFAAHDVAIFMMLLKVARLDNSPDHGDSWIDIAGYAGLGGEVSGGVFVGVDMAKEPDKGEGGEFWPSDSPPDAKIALMNESTPRAGGLAIEYPSSLLTPHTTTEDLKEYGREHGVAWVETNGRLTPVADIISPSHVMCDP